MLKKLAIAVALFATALALAWQFSPWPAALFYRTMMDKWGVGIHDLMAKHVPPGITEDRDIAYAPADPHLKLDVFRPAKRQGETLPAVVWIHGGGFISGGKDQIANYLKVVADKGYAVFGVDYDLAPGKRYPVPVQQAGTALAFIAENAKRFGIDATRIVLAGDSAGAQIAAQEALIVGQPDYAARIGIAPAVSREALRGVILHCGFHDPSAIKAEGAFSGFVQAVTWSYFGTKHLKDEPRAKDFSIVDNVGPGFPPMFISAGNADPLGPQSVKLAEVAAGKGVAVDSLFYPADQSPPLDHEYQFNLDTDAGQTALSRTEAFLAKVMR